MDYLNALSVPSWVNTVLIFLVILGGGFKWAVQVYQRSRREACADKDDVIQEWRDLYQTASTDLTDFKQQLEHLRDSIGFCVDGLRGLHRDIGDVKNVVAMVHEDLAVLATKKGRVTKADLSRVSKRSTSKIVSLKGDGDING